MRGALRLAASLVFLVTIACGSRVIKKEEIQRISKHYEGVYLLRDRVETGNFDSLNKGARVKIFFKAAGALFWLTALPFSPPGEELAAENPPHLLEGYF